MLQSSSRGGGLPVPGGCLPGLGGCLPGLGGCLPGLGGVCLVWGGCLPGPGGVSAWSGGSAWSRGGFSLSLPGGGPAWRPPLVDRITDTCKNITLATTSLRPVIIFRVYLKL